MAEELILTTPVTPIASPTTKYRVSSFMMDLEAVAVLTSTPDPGVVSVKVKDDTGKYSSYQYTGKDALNMIKQLNTANMTNKSMQKRILEKLSADGMLPGGTVQGTPDPIVP